MSELNPWLNIAPDSDFSIHNLPFGIFSLPNQRPRVGVAIGEFIIDLPAASQAGVFAGLNIPPVVLEQPQLNDLMLLGKTLSLQIRHRLQQQLCDATSALKVAAGVLVSRNAANMHMPVQVGDYTDFYSSIEHATNVGKMFRDPENALLPNWKHIPVGYHGRASSIIPSGEPIRRPKGQTLPKGQSKPVFQASQRLDFELEMAFIIGKESKLGQPISTQEANEYIFGMVLFNDWSARDIQKWEYVPLGPFLGKNFASSISPWVVMLEALEPFKVAGPIQDPPVLPYLEYQGDSNYDIDLEVGIAPEGKEETLVSKSNFKYMYWNMQQQLAHHTVNGCNVRVGDMLASGTISGHTPDSYGSMLELSWSGSKPLTLADGSARSFIENGDTVKMRGFSQRAGKRVGFGELSTKVLPSHP
ncbi:MAG: fumarylacetoacetase [Saprospiraceae bacterium]|nr:fumarylacetoacetase [Saprospiraceae bacterium]